MTVLIGKAATVDGALRLAAAQFGSRLAYVDGEHRLTYAEWARAAAGLAAELAEAGVVPGSVVCLMMPSSASFAVAYAAVAWLGATVTATDPRLGTTELQRILAKARPAVTIGAEYSRNPAVAAASGGQLLTVAQARRAFDRAPAPSRDHGADSPAVITWTSGSTGAAKGAWFSHRALESAAYQSGPLSAAHDRRLISTPFAHAGFLARVWDQIAWGITSVLTPPRWTAADMLALLENERVTVGQGVPAQWERLLAEPGLDAADLSALRIVATGATRVPPELVRELRHRLGCPVLVRFACSEVPVATGTSPDDDADTAAETVGRPAPGVEVRVLGEPGAVGPLQLRSPGAMSGYWDDPAATAAAMTADGWIDTGDLARLRTDGNLILAGRAAEMYIRNGYNVHPLEVERTLQEHPAVQAAAVVGVRAPVAGEQGVAFVVASATPDELRAWCRDRLASYKIPAHIELVAALPTNAMSKVDKRALRAIAGHLL